MPSELTLLEYKINFARRILNKNSPLSFRCAILSDCFGQDYCLLYYGSLPVAGSAIDCGPSIRMSVCVI